MDGKSRSIERDTLRPGRPHLSWRIPMAATFAPVASVKAPEFFVPAFFAAPSWSPAGDAIAAVVHNGTPGMPCSRRLIPARAPGRTSLAASVTRRSRRGCRTAPAFCLSPIKPTSFVSIRGKSGFNRIRAASRIRVTPDLLEYRNVSVRADGAAFVSVGLDAAYTLWRIPLRGGSPQRIASERYDGLLGVAPLADGRTIVSRGSGEIRNLPCSPATAVAVRF